MRTEYCIEIERHISDLVRSVNTRLRQGYAALGGPFTLDRDVCQALIKVTIEPLENTESKPLLYEIDGVQYCGRCHEHIPMENTNAEETNAGETRSKSYS